MRGSTSPSLVTTWKSRVLRPFLKELMSLSALRLGGREFHIPGPAELKDPSSDQLVLQKMGCILPNVEELSICWWDLLGRGSMGY